jgi:hypothetical protein
MADTLTEKKVDVTLTEVEPTLFIALGGTGAEILWRIRRRILNTLWGAGTNQPVRLDQLTEFPFAEFLHIDLDAGTINQQGTAAKTDILSEKVKFKEEERLIKKLDIWKYVKTDEDLGRYPIVQEWFPLTRSKLVELNLNVEDGAGQIRAISRLYLFDKYSEIKSSIRTKVERLVSNVSSAESQRRLGLKMQTGKLKIVVVASTAGGTGSGTFIDMGYIANIVGKQIASQGVTTNLVLMLPTGYSGAGLSRTQGNTFGALMELETSMRQGSRYVKRWAETETIRDMPETPYSNVYLTDTANLAGAQTSNIKDLYDMLADALFEDFSTAEFANRKRSISVNQNQHKIQPYLSRVDQQTYGDMKLMFSRSYSSFGQATIDTHLEQKKNIVLFRQVNGMLKAFFGVSSGDTKVNSPTEQERDELLASRMYLGVDNEIVNYDFVEQTDEYRNGAERTVYPILMELMRVNGVSRLDDIETKIRDTFEQIGQGGSYKEWPVKIAEAIKQINHDTFKAVESGSGLHEDAIKRRRAELLAELLSAERKDGLIKALWARVDNKERGGLDYTIELILRLKDRMENANTGLVKTLEENGKWFADLSGHLRNLETGTLQDHLQQAIGKLLGGETQAKAKLKQISAAVSLYVRYHIYSAACREAAVLVHELSDGLGKKTGTDEAGNPIWGGFIGQLEEGRNMVRAIIRDAESQIELTAEAMKQGHAMYFVLPAPRSSIDEFEMLPPKQAREWAEQAFEDFGGTQELFDKLKDEAGRSELLGKLRNRALTLISDSGANADEENPLFAALEAHPNRSQLFTDLMQRAMPWVAAKLDKYLKESNPDDQYKCFIGVKDSKKFAARYDKEIKSRVPAMSMMSAKQVDFVEIDTPGKLVCYVELTGLPLPSMKALDDWYTAYVVEDAKVPVHTHRRTSTFVHPRELTTDELTLRMEDFKLFVQAVALGILTRTGKGQDADLYRQRIKGQMRNVNSERMLRLEGLGQYRAALQEEMEEALDELKTPDQLALWVALLDFYRDSVYPIVVKRVGDSDVDEKHLPTLACEGLTETYRDRLIAKVGETTARQLLKVAFNAMDAWCEEIPGSTSDPYPYEVNKETMQNKRLLKPEVRQVGWALAGAGAAAPPAAMGAVIAPPPGPGAPPPAMAAVPDIQFHIMVGSQQYGPYPLVSLAAFVPTGQLTAASMVWRAGMQGWMAAAQVPELAPFFGPPLVGAVPPPPPPVATA